MSKKLDNRLIAMRYAKATLALAGPDAAPLAADAEALQQAFDQPDMQRFLHNPLLSRNQGAEIAKAVLSKIGAPELLIRSISRMAQNRRLAVVPEMLEQFVRLVEEKENIMRIKIISAKPLSEADIKQLTDKIANAYKVNIRTETKIDPSLIGGVVLQMADKRIDYSAAGKLGRLAEHLKHSPIFPAHAGI